MGDLRFQAALMALCGLVICAGCENHQDGALAALGSCQPAPERLAELGCVEVRFAPSREEAARVCHPRQRFVANAPCPREANTLLVCNEQAPGTISLSAVYYFDRSVPASREHQHAQAAERCARLGGTQGALPTPATDTTLESNPAGDVRFERTRRDLLQRRIDRIQELSLLSWQHWVEGPSERFAARELGALFEDSRPQLATNEIGRSR